MKYPPSIMTERMGECFLCGSRQRIHIHHIFPGSYRKKSTEHGLVVPLCADCHVGPHGVHSDIKKMNRLRELGQIEWERRNPGKSFIKEFGRNWKTED